MDLAHRQVPPLKGGILKENTGLKTIQGNFTGSLRLPSFVAELSSSSSAIHSPPPFDPSVSFPGDLVFYQRQSFGSPDGISGKPYLR